MKSHAVADAMVCSKSLAKAPVPAEPCEGALDDPAAGQHLEAFGLVGALDDIERPRADLAERVPELVTGIAAVGEQVAQPWEAVDDPGQHQRRSIAILDIGRMDHGMNQVALGIGQDMALAALDLLARVIAARPAGFGGFDALTVDHPGTGRSLAAMGFARGHQQVMVETSP